MEDLLIRIGQIVLFIAVAGLILLLNFYRYKVEILREIPSLYKLLPQQKLKENYKVYLAENISFYNKLNHKSKIQFEKRVQQFINMKQFISRSEGLEITDEMRVIIAGVAVLLTYGFPKVYLSHFNRILIYNDNYYSTITKKYHKGEVNPRGIIVLSWSSLKEGFNDKEDGINLGIHEMAHALRIEDKVRNEEFMFFDQEAISRFDKLADIEILKKDSGSDNQSVLRDYSITDKQEFFAVAVEFFFENPQSLKDVKPELYYSLTKLLRIDPSNPAT